MRRASLRILASLLASALVLEPTIAPWAGGSDVLDGPTLVLPEERDAFEFVAPASAGLRLLDPLPFTRLEFGPRIGLGFDVGQFGLLDPGTTVSFDLRLSWPGAPGLAGGEPGTLQPYVALGPALLVADRPDMASPLGPHADATLAVGVKAGAGLAWQLDRDTALFGEYRVTRGRQDLLGPFGGRSSGDIGGFDLLYGLRLRF